MSAKSYKVSWAKIGNSSGYRLPSDFFKENPGFAGADGVVQVISPDTALFSIAKSEAEQAEDELMLRLYLDFLTKQALANSDELEEYTLEMAKADDDLIVGVELDE